MAAVPKHSGSLGTGHRRSVSEERLAAPIANRRLEPTAQDRHGQGDLGASLPESLSLIRLPCPAAVAGQGLATLGSLDSLLGNSWAATKVCEGQRVNRGPLQAASPQAPPQCLPIRTPSGRLFSTVVQRRAEKEETRRSRNCGSATYWLAVCFDLLASATC